MIAKGDIFPKKETLDRMALELQWEQMLHGTYHYIKVIAPKANARGLATGTATETKIDPLVPIPALISEIMADLLYGEFPYFNFDNPDINTKIGDWLKGRHFMTDLLEATTYASAMGTIFWYLFKMDGRVFYSFLKPTQLDWTEDPLGLTSVRIFSEVKGDSIKKKIQFKVQEHYYKWDETKYKSPLMDENRAHWIKDYTMTTSSIDRKVIKVEVESDIASGLKLIPIIKHTNMRQMGIKTGKSDYQGKEQLFSEIDNRVDQINDVLTEHAEPWVGLPPGVLNEKGQFVKSYGKMFEKSITGGSGDNDISIAQWDAQLTAGFEQIRTMMRLVLFTSRISDPISGFIGAKGGQAESGRALKWRSINTFSMINRKRKYWDETLQAFFNMVVLMDDDLKGLDVSKLIVEWQDSLPLDDTEIVDNVVKQVEAGIMSKQTAIEETREIEPDSALAEYNKILAEQGQSAEIKSTAFRVEV